MSSQAARPQVSFAAGPFGDQLEANGQNRLSQFIVNAESEPIRLFSSEARELAVTGEWYGEHAGKWLLAASRRYEWSCDPQWLARIVDAAEALVSCQEPSGYLGAYAQVDGRRFTDPLAAGGRTWDIWVNAYCMLGLLAASEAVSRTDFADAAESIGKLVVEEFSDNPARLLQYGNHEGMSALVVIEPLARLARREGGERFGAFALELVEAAEDSLRLLSSPPDRVGTGKIYQFLWILDGLVALDAAVEDDRLMPAVLQHWQAVSDCHLSPMGGPWGGVANHKEVFNPPGFFDPSGMTETCSTMAWMLLNRSLYERVGDQKFLHAYQASLWNALLGAADPNGSDWIYFSFPNGLRCSTYYWACCRSSGALALEDAAAFAVNVTGSEVVVNLASPLKAKCGDTEFEVKVSPDWETIQVSRLSGDIAIRVMLPACHGGGALMLGTGEAEAVHHAPQAVQPMFQVKHLDHHGQTIMSDDYLCVSRGPYVYATGLIDGFRRQETLRIARLNAADHFRIVGDELIDLVLPGRPPIRLEPYYQAGGRGHGGWRAAWLQVAWQ